MEESFSLFDSTCNSRRFLDTSVVLFFTKIDCLEDKLATSPVNNYFSDFSGDPTYLEDVKDYFEMRFLSLNQNPKNKIDVYFTTLTSDTSLGWTAFTAIEKNAYLREGKKEDKDGKSI